MSHQITIEREGDLLGDLFIARFTFSYETKDIVKFAGFQFDATRKIWWTRDPAVAAKLDPTMRDTLIEASRATDAEIDVPAPAGLTYLPFQKAAISYAIQRKAVLFADEMGLGKTLECIGTLEVTNSYPAFIVVPASLKINWLRELGKWSPTRSTVIISGKPSGDVFHCLQSLGFLDAEKRNQSTQEDRNVFAAVDAPFKTRLRELLRIARAAPDASGMEIPAPGVGQPADQGLVSVVDGHSDMPARPDLTVATLLENLIAYMALAVNEPSGIGQGRDISGDRKVIGADAFSFAPHNNPASSQVPVQRHGRDAQLFRHLCDRLTALLHTGDDRVYRGLIELLEFAAKDVLILNYDIASAWQPVLEALGCVGFVADEAHFLKNPKALRTKSTLSIARYSRRTLFASGSPIVNRPVELWPLVQATNAGGLGRKGFMAYASRYCGAVKNRFGWDFSGASNLEELQRILRESVMVRRLKSEVLTELPAKRRQIMVMPAPDDLRPMLAAEIEAYDAYEAAKDAGLQERTTAFTRLSDLRHQTAMAKVPLALEHIRGLLEETDKLVIFAHHRDVVEALRDYLFDYGVATLTGEDSMIVRQKAVDAFQTDPACRVFIGSIQAAGVGLTLTATQTACFVEMDWVPGNMSQAEDRLHRIGQQGSVLVQHLVLDDSLDARMARVITEKQAVLDAALDNHAPAPAPEIVPYTEMGPTSTDAKPELSLAQVEAIHQGLRILAGVCDGAVERDGCGFNANDTAFGHSLAAAGSLTQKQAQAARRMIILYQRQLPAELVATVKGA